MDEIRPTGSSVRMALVGVLRVMREHRTLLAALVGLLLPATRMAFDLFAVPVDNMIDLPVRTGIYIVALSALCWPLTSYALAFRLTLVSAIALVCVGTANIFLRETGDTSLVPWIIPVGVVSVFAAFWGIGFAILSGLVFVRMRYWPVYPPGHCRACGYNLFGLQDPRCPECGTAFTRNGSLCTPILKGES
jgi:hypothetical protein